MEQPFIGQQVYYNSYGTPGGEYLPEPRVAFVTELREVDTALTSDEPSRIEYIVGLCVLNPTGLFFNREVHYSEFPKPGCWNYIPQR